MKAVSKFSHFPASTYSNFGIKSMSSSSSLGDHWPKTFPALPTIFGAPVVNVIIKFLFSTNMVCRIKAIWLDVPSHMTIFNQSECIISLPLHYTKTSLWHGILDVPNELRELGNGKDQFGWHLVWQIFGEKGFLIMCHSWSLFLYFRLFNTVNKLSLKICQRLD